MTALVATETLLLVLLAVLVAGLLRGQAEILRRLGPPEDGGVTPADAQLPPPPTRSGASAASDIAGTALDGRAVQIGIAAGGASTLLAFLSSGCVTCEAFWQAFSSPGPPPIPGGARLIAVTKDPSHESPSRLRELAAQSLPVVMSSAAWEAYQVPTAPYFVYVDGPSGEVHGEGAATGWAQVASLLRDALDDVAAAGGERGDRQGPRATSGAARAARIDRELEAAGIGPDHPSLYPGERPAREGEE